MKKINGTDERKILNFNNHWGFYRGDLEGAEAVAFNDSAFAEITLPHTMRLEKKHANGGGSVYQGIGWYRRYFTVDEQYKGKTINIDFEGVMTDSEVYLNGEKIYTRNGGYVGFSADITSKVNYGESNVLAVKVFSYDNPDTPPGKPLTNLDFHYFGGIYRDVKMRMTNNLHISDALQTDQTASGGIFVTFPEVTNLSATVNVKTHVVNKNYVTVQAKVISKVMNKDGHIVAQGETESTSLAASGDHQFNQNLSVTNPDLWSPDTPYLYSLVSEVYKTTELVDSITTKIGIRTIQYKPDGLYLNGQKIFVRGANRHQAFQNVGDAAPASMQYRDALQIKENGFNAVRATHYPNDSSFLDATDEIGLLVIECQPGWQNFTNSATFYDLTLRDVREMIRRDRNRPSVVLWETSLNETRYSAEWAQEATQIAHEEYPGDQMNTAADYGLQGSFYDVNYKVVDTGWNADPSKWTDFDPNKPFFTREWGDFEEPSKALRKQGEAAMNTQIATRQRYLNGDGYSDWGGLDANDRIGGYFLWSWNDYARGSTTRTLGSGTVDIDRYEKYNYYWFQSMQSAKEPVYGPMIFIASTYSPASSLTVNVFSNCDSVKLYQNNELVKEITRKEASSAVPNIVRKGGSPIFTFDLNRFISGELRAEAILDGKVVNTYTVKTPGRESRIEIEVRLRGIEPVADGSDLIPVYFKVVDENGTIVPTNNRSIKISVTGEGQLVGKDIPRIGVEEQRVEGGIGFAFVRTSHISGNIQIAAASEGLISATENISTVPYLGQFVPDGQNPPWVGGVEKLESDEEMYRDISNDQEPGDIIANDVIESIEASSGSKDGRGTDKLRDGITTIGTGWLAISTALPQSVTVKFKKPLTVTGSRIFWEKDSNWYTYDLEVSTDGVVWQKALNNHLVGGQHFTPEAFVKPYEKINYVRITINHITAGGGYRVGMAELILYGQE